eukprot:2751643-Rhodomonas_salina.3
MMSTYSLKEEDVMMMMSSRTGGSRPPRPRCQRWRRGWPTSPPAALPAQLASFTVLKFVWMPNPMLTNADALHQSRTRTHAETRTERQRQRQSQSQRQR